MDSFDRICNRKLPWHTSDLSNQLDSISKSIFFFHPLYVYITRLLFVCRCLCSQIFINDTSIRPSRPTTTKHTSHVLLNAYYKSMRPIRQHRQLTFSWSLCIYLFNHSSVLFLSSSLPSRDTFSTFYCMECIWCLFPILFLLCVCVCVLILFPIWFPRRFGQIRFKWPGKVFHNDITSTDFYHLVIYFQIHTIHIFLHI